MILRLICIVVLSIPLAPILITLGLIDWLMRLVLAPEPVRCDGGEPEKYDLWMWIR